MDDFASGMLGILPPLIVGGAALMLTDRFIRQPMQQQEEMRPRRRRQYFDKQEYKDSKPRGRGMGFGDFRNIGW